MVASQTPRPPSIVIQRRQPTVQTVPLPTVPLTTVAPQRNQIMEDLEKKMRDLQIKLTRLEEKGGAAEGRLAPKQGYVQRCIWCDSTDHQRKECGSFADVLQQGVIFWKEGKIALRDSGETLRTNFGRGGMKKVLEDHLSTHDVASVEAAAYGVEVVDKEESAFLKHVDTTDMWSHAVSTIRKGKIAREELLRTATTIRSATGWDDPVDTMSVHAYVAKTQDEAIMEEKRRRDEANPSEERAASKRQLRGDRLRQETTPLREEVMEDVLPSRNSEKGKGREKSKAPMYKLQSDIEAATNLKEVLQDKVLNTKIEFTLREILGIAKKEFHDVIIDIIKRKRQLTGETAVSSALDTVITEEEEQELAHSCNTRKVRFDVDDGESDDKSPSHYTREHWARATTETLVKLGDMADPVIALIDHGSEINIVSKDIYKRGRWPIDTEHGWMIRAANNTRGDRRRRAYGILIR